MKSNEKKIREELRTLLRNKYKSSVIVDEFTAFCMKTRTDLTAITKTKLIHCEIKSNLDVLSNLTNQIVDYISVGNKVILALDITHLKKFKQLNLKFDFLEVYFYDAGKLSLHKSASYEESKIKMFDLLWNDEYKLLYEFLKGRSKINSHNRKKVLHSLYSARELIKYTHEILYNRMKNKPLIESNQRDPGRLSKDIKNKSIKQDLFNLYLSGDLI